MSGCDSSRSNIQRARAYLLRVAEPPAKALRAFVARTGPVRAAELVRAGEVPEAVKPETSARCSFDLAERDLELAAGCGARLVLPEDDEWPGWRFLAFELAARGGHEYGGEPLALWVRGLPLNEFGDHSAAIVGARAASGYGVHVAADLAYGIAETGFGVVSGAAYGIDGAAHRGALAAGGRTIAVLACGIDVVYPSGHDTLFGHILEQGSLVSEYPPGSSPARFRFLVRNRLIAAFGDGTVVVEAGRRSGARNTAITARALGRPLLAVPGPVTSAMSVGCHDLLRAGEARIAAAAGDVIDAVGPLDAVAHEAGAGQRSAVDELERIEQRVLECLGARRGRGVERVAAESGVDPDTLQAVLPVLERAGFAERTDAGWRRTVEFRRAGGEGARSRGA